MAPCRPRHDFSIRGRWRSAAENIACFVTFLTLPLDDVAKIGHAGEKQTKNTHGGGCGCAEGAGVCVEKE